jgi:hypothetical protein
MPCLFLQTFMEFKHVTKEGQHQEAIIKSEEEFQ